MSDPTQAQAEDRRAQVIEEAESYLEWLREGGNGDVADSITALLVELSRLSRVEQALREQFTNLLASATQLVDSHPGRFRYLEYDVRALTVSPEAQP